MKLHDRQLRQNLLVGCSVLVALVIAQAVFAQDAASPSSTAETTLSVETGDVEAETKTIETTANLPLVEQTPRPTADEILHKPPIDWLIVASDRLLRVEPVQPRPRTLEVMQSRIDKFAATKPQTVDAAKVAAWRKEFDKVYDIEVRLIENDRDAIDYWLSIAEVDGVIHHETHAINEAARLRDKGDFPIATELLEHVRRRDPAWPGLDLATNELLFAEASAMLAKGDAEHALVTLERLFESDPKFQNLNVRVGQAVRTLGQNAIQQQHPRRCRYFETRLRNLFPQHPVLAELAGERDAVATALLTRAKESRSYRDASEFVGEAARYSPELRGLSSAHETYFNRYPVLHAGVLELAASAEIPILAGPESRRLAELTSARLFEPASVEGDIVRFRSHLVESWRPEDLDRRAVIELASTSLKLDAYYVAEQLDRRASRPEVHGDRWNGAILSVYPVTPKRIEIQLGKGPLRLDALLGEIDVPVDPPFQPSTADVSEQSSLALAVFRSTTAESERLRGEFAELVEHQYPTAEAFGRGIRRDEIAIAVDVPPYLVARLTQEKWFAKEVILDRATVPMTHLLQFRVGSHLWESTSLRIALARAIDRDDVLAKAILHNVSRNGPGSEYARVTDNVFPGFSYANNRTVEHREFEPAAAVPLALLGRRELGEKWGAIRVISPFQSQIRSAAQMVVESWRELGIPAELVPIEETAEAVANDNWDVAYRVVALNEPSIDLWPLLSADGRASLDGIDHLPEPLRERLIRLENTRDWPTASSLLADCHLSIIEQAILLPLWEIDRLSVRRRSIRGVPEKTLTPYDGLKRWRVEPIFSTTVD